MATAESRSCHVRYVPVSSRLVTLRGMMRKDRMLLLIWLVLLGMSAWPMAVVAAEQSCGDCHREVVERGMGKRYVHMPFLKKQCAACHVSGQTVSVPTRQQIAAVKEPLPEKVRWFRDAPGVAVSHWVLLSPDQLGDTLIYKAWDGASRMPMRQLAVPPLATLPNKANDGKPPTISAVEVLDVRRGISTTATIAWNTDEFADSQVAYGPDAPSSTKADRKLTRRHQVLLTGLDKDKAYRFQVISSDLFGNRAQSAVQEFATDKTFMLDESRHEEAGGAGSKVEVTGQLFRQGEQYLAVFEANRPVSLSLGVPEVEEGSLAQQTPRQVVDSPSHPVLKSQVETNISACDGCHAYLKQGYSHPVNVFPKPGMVIPKEYRLLPDGRISCMSCHVEHGGDYEHRLLKSGKKDLCLGCHTDY